MDKIRAFIENYSVAGDAEWEVAESFFERKEFGKNEVILEVGGVCRHFYFLESGLIRFYYNIDGSDVTKSFAMAPYCFTSRTSFRKQAPSSEGIQVLLETVVWEISYHKYQRLTELKFWNLFMRKILDEVQEFTESFYLDAKTHTAEARYRKLLQEYPEELLRKIPLRHLSTYLGVAPQSLSRIRRKLKFPEP